MAAAPCEEFMFRHIVMVAILMAGLAVARDARACLAFDHPAELRLIDKAIADEAVPKERRILLAELRDAIVGNEESHFPAEQAKATVQALRLIGKQRIVRPLSPAGVLAAATPRPSSALPDQCG
jgi:hypothetical protein